MSSDATPAPSPVFSAAAKACPRHVGILTGGGDCPGLNAVIRAVAKTLIHRCGAQVIGIEQGFLGLIERRTRPLDLRAVSGILHEGGTILGSNNRANPFAWRGADVSGAVIEYARELGLDALVAIGGDGTMTIAHGLAELGLAVVGVPKTIDNDLFNTDRTFGFDSAVAVVADALARLETTARSHGRVMILETMGRQAGWIALEGGLAGAADVILLPELPYRLDTIVEVCRAREAVQGYTLICVSEGARAMDGNQTVKMRIEDSPEPVRLGGVGQVLQEALQPHLQSEVRSTLLGHLQRGGTPTGFDRVLATRFGHHAALLLERGEVGRMVTLAGTGCSSVALADVAGAQRTVPLDHPLLATARAIGVSLGD